VRGRALLLGLALAGCGLPEPGPLARVAGWSPRGTGVDPGAQVRVEFSHPVSPQGLLDGRLVALAAGADARAVAAAVEGPGVAEGVPVLACARVLEDGGRRLVLRPVDPLPLGEVVALVLGTGALRDVDGRPVLDPDGRHRTFVATFEVEPPPPGPPPRPLLTEVRADAATPEAGGEYVEVLNLGEGPLDLEGWRLVKRTASGATAACTASLAAGGPVAPGRVGLLVGGAWDGRYAVPPGVPRWACGASSLAGGLANDVPPWLQLVDPAGGVQATLGAGGAPRCPAALELLDLALGDLPGNLACADGQGSPGAPNPGSPPGSWPAGP
jgi:hypothetical protein